MHKNEVSPQKLFNFDESAKVLAGFCDLPASGCLLILTLLQEVQADLGLCFPCKHTCYITQVLAQCRAWVRAGALQQKVQG